MAQRNGGPWGKGKWVREGFPEMGDSGRGHVTGEEEECGCGLLAKPFYEPLPHVCASQGAGHRDPVQAPLFTHVLAPPWPSVTPWGRPQSTWEALEGTKELRTSKQEVPCLPLVPQQSTCSRRARQAPGLRCGLDLTQACASAARTVSGSFLGPGLRPWEPSAPPSHPLPPGRTRGDTGQWYGGACPTGAPHSSATPASLWFKVTSKQTLVFPGSQTVE